MDIVDLVRKLITGPLTEGQAAAICKTAGEEPYSDDAGTVRLLALGGKLRQHFPNFPWRVALCHDRARLYWALTIHDPDPREHTSKHDD